LDGRKWKMATKLKTAAEILKENYIPTRLSFSWWGQSKKVEKATQERMANYIDANARRISAGKRIYSTEIECIAEINALKTEIKDYWEDQTLPYSQEGIRLLPRAKIETFNLKMQDFEGRLRDKATVVHLHRAEIIEDAQKELGDAFSLGNYPLDLTQLYRMEVSFPSIEPAEGLPPQVYQQQSAYAQRKIEEAVQMAETAFSTQMMELIEHLREKLQPGPDGQKKIFRDSAVENLKDFFRRFKELNLGSSEQLDQLVCQAEEIVAGISAEDLRKGKDLRDQIGRELKEVSEALTPLVTTKPRRVITVARKADPSPSTNGQQLQLVGENP
jgi:hypothetical protein